MADAHAQIARAGGGSPLRRLALALTLGFVLLGALWAFWPDVAAWARETQRLAQAELAAGVRAVRSGDSWAMAALLGACFSYGFAHAIGPGHGKLVIGGAAAASRRTARRMAGLGVAASLTQGVSAILLAYGALGLFSMTGRAATGLAEGVFAPLSAAAVALVGLLIFWRGLRGWPRAEAAHQAGCDQSGCASGCRHGPSAGEVEQAEGWREAAGLVLAIGLRPCSGALIVLAIAWNFELYLAGALGALAMGAGTGLVVGGVALAAASLRDAGALTRNDHATRRLFAGVQMGVGGLVAGLSALFLAASLGL